MVALAAGLVVGLPCVTFLVAFRWWLSERRPTAELLARLESLEQKVSRESLRGSLR